MSAQIVEIARGLVRPIVTVGLVASTVAAVFTGQSDENIAVLLALTGTTIGFWFASRPATNGK